jgi:geranylgeranyl pyrophosphate synthase
VALRILDEVDHMLVESLEGQATELGWVRDNHLTVGADDYLRLVLKRPRGTASFIQSGSARSSPRQRRQSRPLRSLRLSARLAFQITDDVLNLSGDVARYGKEIDGDLWEGKRTLILAHALEHATRADRAWISSFLARPRERRLPREVLRLHQILATGGSIQWAQQSAAALAEAAAHEFDTSAFAGVSASPDLDWLRSCVNYLVQRDV